MRADGHIQYEASYIAMFSNRNKSTIDVKPYIEYYKNIKSISLYDNEIELLNAQNHKELFDLPVNSDFRNLNEILKNSPEKVKDNYFVGVVIKKNANVIIFMTITETEKQSKSICKFTELKLKLKTIANEMEHQFS